MPIPSRGIGWSTQDNMLWQIAKQLEGASCQLCDLNSNIESSSYLFDYLSAFSTQDFTGGSIQAFTFNNTDFSKGVSIANSSEITFTKLGKFNIQFSAQIYKSGGTGTNIYIWLRHNGVDVPDSATVLQMGNNDNYKVAAWNFFVDVNTNPQQFQLMWYTPSSNVSIETLTDAQTPAGVPGVPSVILTVNQIGG